jgi:hypothetical protein
VILYRDSRMVNISFHFTEYVETAPVSALDPILWIEVDRMKMLDVSPVNLENQRKVGGRRGPGEEAYRNGATPVGAGSLDPVCNRPMVPSGVSRCGGRKRHAARGSWLSAGRTLKA